MKKIISLLLALVLVFALSVSALAANPEEVDLGGAPGGTPGSNSIEVNGEIGVKNVSYKITYAGKVNWYVTETSYPNVWNGIARNTENPNTIKNNSNSMEYKLTLKNIKTNNNDATTVAKNLKLNLTGSLAANPLFASTNISGG